MSSKLIKTTFCVSISDHTFATYFVHATTRFPRHVQHFVAITWFQSEWELIESSIALELHLKIIVKFNPEGPFYEQCFNRYSNSMEISFSATPLWGITSLQNFAHGTTIPLSCHMQNFTAITWMRVEWNFHRSRSCDPGLLRVNEPICSMRWCLAAKQDRLILNHQSTLLAKSASKTSL